MHTIHCSLGRLSCGPQHTQLATLKASDLCPSLAATQTKRARIRKNWSTYPRISVARSIVFLTVRISRAAV